MLLLLKFNEWNLKINAFQKELPFPVTYFLKFPGVYTSLQVGFARLNKDCFPQKICVFLDWMIFGGVSLKQRQSVSILVVLSETWMAILTDQKIVCQRFHPILIKDLIKL